MKKRDLVFPLILILTLVALRLGGHAANVSPFLGLALFSGILLKSPSLGFLIPLLALFLSDFKLDLYPGWMFVYGPMALMGVLGAKISPKALPWFSAALGGSLFFFLVSNFGVWLSSGLYALDFSGLLQCYSSAIPFFHRTVVSTMVTTGVCFGVYRFASSAFPSLLDRFSILESQNNG